MHIQTSLKQQLCAPYTYQLPFQSKDCLGNTCKFASNIKVNRSCENALRENIILTFLPSLISNILVNYNLASDWPHTFYTQGVFVSHLIYKQAFAHTFIIFYYLLIVDTSSD